MTPNKTHAHAQTGKTLHESEEEYRLLVETLNEGIWRINSDGHTIFVNPKMADILGYTANEMLGRHLFSFMNDSWAKFAKERLILRSQGVTEQYELQCNKKDGSQVYLLFSATPAYDGEGKYSGGLAVVTDITERKQAEKMIRDSKEKYKTILETAIDGFWITDTNGSFIEVNETYVRMSGYSRSALLTMQISDVDAGQNKGAMSEQFGKGIKKEFGRFETIHRKKDNSLFQVEVSFRYLTIEGGIFVVFIKDITDRKLAEDTLKRKAELNKAIADISKELLSEVYDFKKVSEVILAYARNLTDSAHGFVSSIDQTTLENVGHTLTDMFGKQCKIKGRRISSPVSPDGKYPALWGYALNTQKPFFTNQPYTHPNATGIPAGHIPIMNYLAVPVLLKDKLAGLIAVANADREYNEKDLEAVERLSDIYALALHRYHYELEKIRMEKQLLQMQKLEAIGTLAGGIAHDFNNILCPIIGMAELLVEDLPHGSPERENAHEIFKAGKRGSGLVEQILAFSRQSESKTIPLRIQSVLKEVIKLTRSTIPTDIQIINNIPPDIGMVMADPTQLHQVIMNLITNAYHAVEPSGGAITVSLEETHLSGNDIVNRLLNPGRYAHMSVSDTGTGIDPSIMDKIFEPYFTTKIKGKGTGLGLSVVHGIIKDHKGDIQVVSEVGKGTTFHIYLPLISRTEEADIPEKTVNYGTGTERILLVDDEKQIAKLLKIMLERLGYRVAERFSSLDALEAFRANPDGFDLVVTDMTMPNLTGDDLAKELISIRPDIPIIICTGYSERINEASAKAIGISGFLMKPVVKSKVAELVRNVLDEAKT